jgi:hypothetical protein
MELLESRKLEKVQWHVRDGMVVIHREEVINQSLRLGLAEKLKKKKNLLKKDSEHVCGEGVKETVLLELTFLGKDTRHVSVSPCFWQSRRVLKTPQPFTQPARISVFR